MPGPLHLGSVGKQQSVTIELLPSRDASGLGQAGHKPKHCGACTNCPMVLMQREKPLRAAATCCGSSRRRGSGRESCPPLPSHPLLSGTVAPQYPGISFHRRKGSGLVCGTEPAGCWALRLFLAAPPAACVSIPNSPQPFAPGPRRAARTSW